jgi:hypothetical protein
VDRIATKEDPPHLRLKAKVLLVLPAAVDIKGDPVLLVRVETFDHKDKDKEVDLLIQVEVGRTGLPLLVAATDLLTQEVEDLPSTQVVGLLLQEDRDLEAGAMEHLHLS